MKKMNVLVMAGLLAGSSFTFTAVAPQSGSAAENLEIMKLLVDSLPPIVKLTYMRDAAKRDRALQVVAFFSNAMGVMQDLNKDVPRIPAEFVEAYKRMLIALQASKVEFDKAKNATVLDDQTQNVLKGLNALNDGLVAPGDYLISLNEKTFKKILELFEGLPVLSDMMGLETKKGWKALSELITDMFTELSNITKKYTAGLKATNRVVDALLKENMALKAEIASMQGSRGVIAEEEVEVVAPTVAAPVSVQSDTVSLDDLF